MLRGLREVLNRGVASSLTSLGAVDGYLKNPKVHIPLPPLLAKAAPMLRTFGQGKRLDQLETTLNRAAERAVPKARDTLVAAVKDMRVDDARRIVTGGDDSVTRYFETHTRAPIQQAMYPLVDEACRSLDVARQVNRLLGKLKPLGLVGEDEATLQQHVTGKAVDGLFLMVAEQERALRADPIKAGSALLKRVLGG